MKESDLTEYLFAIKHLDSWSHWLQLSRAEFFKPYLSRWREELSLKIKGEALQRLQEVAGDISHRSHTDINKYLANEAWKVHQNAQVPRGRPSKEEVAKAAKNEANALRELNKDFERVLGGDGSEELIGFTPEGLDKLKLLNELEPEGNG